MLTFVTPSVLLFTMTIRQKILKFYSLATPLQISEGKNWYKIAQTYCKQIAKQTGVNHKTVAAVVSALSPSSKWGRNLVDAEALIGGWLVNDCHNVTVSTYNQNKIKAIRILENQSQTLGASRGVYKTVCFWHNLCFPNSQRVVIDRWIMRAVFPSIKKEVATGKLYLKIEEAFQRLAAELNLKPYELQAIIWIVIRDLPRKRKINK